MRIARQSALAFLLATLLCFALPALGESGPVVILLSWDGTRWDYPDRAEFPALGRVAREGVRAERLVPVFPTSTFPNHVSLATGAHVDRHGIVGNVFLDPERGRYSYSADADWIEAEPLWIAAERQGVRAASFFWVGSETDWNGQRATYRRAPFDGDIGEAEKVDQILAWLDLPESERPRLVLSWWHGADGAGHRYGPDSDEVLAALRRQDEQLARLLEGLDAREAWARTTLVIVSDHGMAEVSDPVPVRDALDDAGIEAEIFLLGGFGHVHLEDSTERDAALAALEKLDGVVAFASDALPPELRAHHPRRSGDLTLVAEAPRTLWEARDLSTRLLVTVQSLLGGSFGLHGYSASNPDMHAVFLAMGVGVAPDLELGAVRAIDVAPTVALLLGIDPPRDAEGRPIAGIGATP